MNTACSDGYPQYIYTSHMQNTPLKPPSTEQQCVIDRIKLNCNVCVPSVAGSGKTTTILHIANQLPDKRIGLLTYNARLRAETKERVQNHYLNNIEIQNFHSFCVNHYPGYEGHTDSGINRLLKNPPDPSTTNYSYDILVIDEIQDMNSIYYELSCFVLSMVALNNTNEMPQLCVLGDPRQSIFQYSGADERYLLHADRIFNFNNRKWCTVRLSTSFRITTTMANFINYALMHRLPGNEHIISTKAHIIRREKDTNIVVAAPKPRYHICNLFHRSETTRSAPYNEIVRYLAMGHKPEEIIVMASSIKSERSPIRCLENELKTYLPSLQVFVQTDNDAKIDSDLVAGKILFTTYYKAKGIERGVAIVIGMDNSYFVMREKAAGENYDENPLLLPNPLYVGVTRGLTHLSLFHHFQNDYLPFIDVAQLERTCDMIISKPLKLPATSRPSRSPPSTKVTDLVQHLASCISDDCMKMLNDNNAITYHPTNPSDSIDIPAKMVQPNGRCESVREITGTVIPCYYEYVRSGKTHMSILDQLHSINYHTQIANIHTAVTQHGRNLHQASSSGASPPSIKCLLDDDDDDDDDRVQQLQLQQQQQQLKLLSQSFMEQQASGFMKRQYLQSHAPILAVSSESDYGTEESEEDEDTDLVNTQTEAIIAYDLNKITAKRLTLSEAMFVANCWNAHLSGYVNPVYQIKTYDWISAPQIELCMARMDQLNIGSNGKFEVPMETPANKLTLNRMLRGAADCIDDRYVYEFKCVQSIQPQHILQLVLYIFMNNHASPKSTSNSTSKQDNPFNNPFQKYKSHAHPQPNAPVLKHGRLVNILTNQIVDIVNIPTIIDQIVYHLFSAKYAQKTRISDAHFIKNATNCSKTYMSKYFPKSNKPKKKNPIPNTRSNNPHDDNVVYQLRRRTVVANNK